MHIHVLRSQFGSHTQFAQSIVPATFIGQEDAQIEMRKLLARVNAQSVFQQRPCGLRVFQLHLGVSQVGQGLDVVRVVGQLGLKLAHRLRVLHLGP